MLAQGGQLPNKGCRRPIRAALSGRSARRGQRDRLTLSKTSGVVPPAPCPAAVANKKAPFPGPL